MYVSEQVNSQFMFDFSLRVAIAGLESACFIFFNSLIQKYQVIAAMIYNSLIPMGSIVFKLWWLWSCVLVKELHCGKRFFWFFVEIK